MRDFTSQGFFGEGFIRPQAEAGAAEAYLARAWHVPSRGRCGVSLGEGSGRGAGPAIGVEFSSEINKSQDDKGETLTEPAPGEKVAEQGRSAEGSGAPAGAEGGGTARSGAPSARPRAGESQLRGGASKGASVGPPRAPPRRGRCPVRGRPLL